MTVVLGQGSYGKVTSKDGKAIKKFSKLSHLIQEYIALQYLRDCKYIVHPKGIKIENLEAHMDLYDCSLRKWLEDNKKPSQSDILKILHDVLLGLSELHDRKLAHGDLKPGNILIKKNPLQAVIGDCGFVSIAKFSKVERTAAVYRDPVIRHDDAHDMFSFGICFLEIIADIKITKPASYNELKNIVVNNVTDRKYRKIIYNLLHSDRQRRPTARYLLYSLFNDSPSAWIKPGTAYLLSNGFTLNQKNTDNYKIIRKLMKKYTFNYNLKRGKKGYGALISFLVNNNVDTSLYKIYTLITLFILSSLFGQSGFSLTTVREFSNDSDDDTLHFHLSRLVNDSNYINIILSP